MDEKKIISYDKKDQEIVRGLRANYYPAGTLSDEEVDEIEEVLIKYVVDNM